MKSVKMKNDLMSDTDNAGVNIFENAKLGDKFVTRDGRGVLFLYYDWETDPHSYNCWLEYTGHINYNKSGKRYDYTGDGCLQTDIVSYSDNRDMRQKHLFCKGDRFRKIGYDTDTHEIRFVNDYGNGNGLTEQNEYEVYSWNEDRVLFVSEKYLTDNCIKTN